MNKILAPFPALLVLLLLMIPTVPSAQPTEAIYDEAQVPDYRLPDPLLTRHGHAVRDAETWWSVRRPEIFALFESEVYGRSPGRPDGLHFRVVESSSSALDGLATRTQVRVFFSDSNAGPAMDLLLYVPNDAEKPVPTFLTVNFNGNHTIHGDPAIRITESWVRNNRDTGVTDHKASEAGRGASSSRWPVEMILRRGYALGTVYYGDIDPDYDDGFQNGVHSLFRKPGQEKPDPDEWGSIAAWGWGLSRALDYLETDQAIDHRRVAVMGHSRLGKTALWAGARDRRFAMVISNNSGCGGAALSRRRFGESVQRINTSFPHWFCDNFTRYNHNEEALPVDQHMLIALIAPRPLYVASAVEDRWADPRGEFLSVLHADPVYQLLGVTGLGGVSDLPPVDHPVGETTGYHVRSGGHDVKEYDWKRYLDFADRHLNKS